MSRAETAVKKHHEGYNCSQSVVCAFADELGMDEATLYKLAEGFGGGMGTGQGLCGALIGAGMLSGLVNSDGNIDDAGKTKAASVKAAARIQKIFAEKAKALTCREIKTGNNGGPYTSCDDCIRIATEAAEEVLGM